LAIGNKKNIIEYILRQDFLFVQFFAEPLFETQTG